MNCNVTYINIWYLTLICKIAHRGELWTSVMIFMSSGVKIVQTFYSSIMTYARKLSLQAWSIKHCFGVQIGACSWLFKLSAFRFIIIHLSRLQWTVNGKDWNVILDPVGVPSVFRMAPYTTSAMIKGNVRLLAVLPNECASTADLSTYG